MTRRRTDRRGGAATVELAFLLPFILFLAVIATDWARLFYYTIALETVARAGAQYAADPAARQQSPYTTMSDAALAEAPNLSPAPTVTQSAITVNGRAGVRVTATMTFTTFANFNITTRLNKYGVPQTQTLTRTVDMRLIPTTTN